MILSAEEIEIRERIREELGEEEIAELMTSFLALGQLQPIIVRQGDEQTKALGKRYILVFGERRLESCLRLSKVGKTIKGLGRGYIWGEERDSNDPHVLLQIEFAENMQRKDFSYIEKARFIRKFHESMQSQAIAVGRVWPAELTAVSLSLSPASISQYLRIEEATKTDPGVAKATTLKSAVKRMKVAENLRARQVEVKDNATEAYATASSILRLGDALELIRELPNAGVDLINFDPPWGDDTGHKSTQNHEGFDDDTASSDILINGLLPELYRALKPDRFLIFWYRAWAYSDMVHRLETAGFSVKFGRTPNIWYKPDKVSDQNRFPEKQLLDAYETFIIARKGEAVFNERGHQNVFVYDRVPVASLVHPTEKPIDLCTSLLRICSLPGEVVLDPTAGSASFLDAALRANRKACGFELSSTYHDRGITRLAEYIKTVMG